MNHRTVPIPSRQTNSLLLPLALGALLLAWTPASVSAAEKIDITEFADPSRLIPISLAGYSGEVQNVLKFDLEVSGFKIVTADAAQYHVIGNNDGQVEGRVNDRVTKAAVLENRRYSGGTLRTQAHAFADDIVLKLTGKPGISKFKIAFVGERSRDKEIYVADYDGANAAPVTQDNAVVAAPCWAPGGRVLYYTSYKAGFPDIYRHDVYGSGERKAIANYSGMNTSASVSRDGRVAMILSKGGDPDLYVCDANGGNLKPLTKTRALETTPCWSPDGTTICYVSEMRGTAALYLISPEGGTPRRLLTSGAGKVTEPDWSPDGKSIVFTSQWSQFTICVVPASGGEIRTLVTGEDPCWAPNSRTVIFSRKVNGRKVLSLLDVPTKQVKDVSQILGGCSQPSWAR